MKKIILLLLILGWIFFLNTSSVFSAESSTACATGMIDSISFEAILEDGTTKDFTIYENQPSDVVYQDSTNYYADQAGTQKITNIGNVTIKHSDIFLNSAVSGSQYNIRYTGAIGCRATYKYLQNIKDNNGIWEFIYNYPGNDAACVFGKPSELQYKDSTSNYASPLCSRSYSFSPELIGETNNCSPSVTPPGGATIDDEIIVTFSDIDDEGSEFDLFINGAKARIGTLGNLNPTWPYKVIINTGWIELTKGPDGLKNLIYPYGKQAPGDYLFELKYRKGARAGTNICAINMTVVPSGSTPTPPLLITPGDTETINSITLELASLVSLCESIPDADNRTKCVDCMGDPSDEKPAHVWTGIGCLPTDFGSLVSFIFTGFSGLLGGLLFLCIVFNGFRIMMARGNPETLKQGREALTSCIIGFLIVMFSIFIMKLIGVDILKLPGFEGRGGTSPTPVPIHRTAPK